MTAKLLPTMIPDEADLEPLDDLELLISAFPPGTLTMLDNQGIDLQDVLDGKVPGLDPEAILAQARSEGEESS